MFGFWIALKAGFDQPKHHIDCVQCCTGVLSNLHAVACMPADACMLADAFVLADACMCRITIMYAHMSLVQNGQVFFMSPYEIRAELFMMLLCECLVKASHRIMITDYQPRKLPANTGTLSFLAFCFLTALKAGDDQLQDDTLAVMCRTGVLRTCKHCPLCCCMQDHYHVCPHVVESDLNMT